MTQYAMLSLVLSQSYAKIEMRSMTDNIRPKALAFDTFSRLNSWTCRRLGVFEV